MSLDLAALRERAMPMRDGFYHVVGYYRAFRREDYDALIAEVERLRAENAALEQTSADLCPSCGWRFLVPGHGCLNCDRDREAVQERAAVVEYLLAPGTGCDNAALAEVIESGEHRQSRRRNEGG
jgi:hypothetical protein